MVLDTLTGLLKNDAYRPEEIMPSLSNLAKSIANDPIKRDTLLITLVRYFVEVGVATTSTKVKGSLHPICICIEGRLKHQPVG